MEINCGGCGKCCFSDIPDSWYMEQMILSYEESKKHPKRENIIILTPEEVKYFWEKNLGCSLKVEEIIYNEEKKELFLLITIKNFPKFIDEKWVLCCPFLDNNKRCRIYGTDFFPNNCKEYPFTHINESYVPLCESKRLVGEMNESQKDLKFTMSISLNLSENFDPLQLKEDFGKIDNTRLLNSILYEIYDTPHKLKGKEKIFIKKLFDKINKEIEFQKENFRREK